MTSVWNELKRRNVVKVAIGSALVSTLRCMDSFLILASNLLLDSDSRWLEARNRAATTN
jgi:hypothetical protein